MSPISDIEEENASLKVFPNPSTGIVNLAHLNSKKVSIKVYNVAGQECHFVHEYSVRNSQIDISGLANGVYFISIKSEEGDYRYKVIKSE